MEAAEPYGEELRKSASIFRVPESLRGQNPEHYQPKVVAIGPYHRGNSELLIKDKKKW
ncbi:putative UPF0481 protein [Cocos nucifera]|uniref:Putative UPF0481 protein n=1 Tax=Cocos nucifera TaxID=13894 RepID=A0A8K0IU99_COCNU|nr:putative UPF0481 protein [Cocos nucifera]